MAAGPEAQDVVVTRIARITGGVPADRGATVGPVGAVGGWVPAPPPQQAAPPAPEPDDAGAVDALGDGDVPGGDPGDDATAARRALAAAMASYTAAHGHPLAADDASAPRRVRLATGARVAAAAVVALLLVVGVVAVRAWQRTQSAAVPLDAVAVPVGDVEGGVAGGATGGATDRTGADPAGPTLPAVVVHVVGEVASPGVVALEPGARVADAVAAAGGATPSADLTAVNLARVLADGEQVVVPAPGQAVAAPSAGGTGAVGGGLVDLNRADAAAFDTLPGIGPVLAERIVAWRDAHGRFTAVEELTEVTGIGPALLAGVRDLVQVG